MIALLLAGVLAAAPAALAPAPRPRLALHVAGLGSFAAADAATTHRYPQFAEDVVLEQALTQGSAFGGEVGLTWAVSRRVGLALAGTLGGGRAGGTVSARLPHPLYLDRPRLGTLEPSGLRRTERALHAGPVVLLGSGATTVELSAGLTLLHAAVDVVSAVQYEHAYPYDEARLVGSTRRRAEDAGVGFHVGGAVDRRVGTRLSALLAVRYARVATRPAFEGFEAEVTAGGVTALLGLRFRP